MVDDAVQSVPSGANTYVFKSVLHMHGDDNARKIMRNCRSALAPNSKVIFIDGLLPERRPNTIIQYANLLLDVLMMVLNGGRERTEQDFSSLLDRSGFAQRTHTTPMQYAIIEAVAN